MPSSSSENRSDEVGCLVKQLQLAWGLQILMNVQAAPRAWVHARSRACPRSFHSMDHDDFKLSPSSVRCLIISCTVGRRRVDHNLNLRSEVCNLHMSQSPWRPLLCENNMPKVARFHKPIAYSGVTFHTQLSLLQLQSNSLYILAGREPECM